MISRLLGISAGTPEPTDDFWFTDVEPRTATGMTVNSETALRCAAVYAAVRVLAETVGSLPLITYRRRDDGGKERATDRPVYEVLHDRPNAWQTSFEYFELLMHHLALRGNGVSEARFDAGGELQRLNPIHPDAIEAEQTRGNRIRYEVRPDRDKTRRPKKTLVSGRDVFHVRAMSGDGIWGLNPIQILRRTVALPLGQDEFAARLFKQGLRPSAVFTKEGGRLSDEAHAKITEQLSHHMGASNAHKALILEDGLKFEANMNMTLEDAQFIEARKFSVAEIARIFRVPPHMLQDLERSTFSNIEQQSLDFVMHTIRPWLVRIEQALRRDVINDPELFAEFQVDGLLRADVKTRFDTYALAIQNEILSQNEVRAMENRNPIEGGDTPRNPITAPENGNADDETEAGRIADVFARDIGGRIASAELAELRKRAKHAADDGERWNEWLAEYYTQHAQYMDKAVAPLCDAFQVRNLDRLAFIEQQTRESCRALRQGDAARLVEDWDNGRLAALYTHRLKELVS